MTAKLNINNKLNLYSAFLKLKVALQGRWISKKKKEKEKKGGALDYG